MKISLRLLTIFAAISLIAGCVYAEPKRKGPDMLKKTDKAFFSTPLADRIGRQVVAYQRCTGGWPKNIDMAAPLTEAQMDSVIAEKWHRDDSTTDNNATTRPLTFLANLYQATGDTIYLDSFRRGIEFLLSGQYPNGGWPQFWPENRDYQVHITYNDGAMVNTLNLLREVSSAVWPYTDMIDKETALRIDAAFAKGIECILATQIIGPDGSKTVWCQQHDHVTLLPAPARAYELPSYCSAESAGIVALLMSLPNPDDRIKEAVNGAMKWYDENKITGFRYGPVMVNGELERLLTPDSTASEPLWARFYDLDNCLPFVSDRDGKPVRSLMEIGSERRNGYGWYSSSPAALYPVYEAWRAKN